MSMAQFQRDADGRICPNVTLTDYQGGIWRETGVTANQWYRLMPSGEGRFQNEGREFAFETSPQLRSDVHPELLGGFQLKIVTAGYEMPLNPQSWSGTRAALVAHLPQAPPYTPPSTDLDYVLFPQIATPLHIMPEDNTRYEVGYAVRDASNVDTTSNNDILPIAQLSGGPRTVFQFPCAQVQRLYVNSPATAINLAWGTGAWPVP